MHSLAAPSAPRVAQANHPAKEPGPAPSTQWSGTKQAGTKPFPLVFRFDDALAGSVPEAWSASMGQWRVETIDQAPSGARVFVQSARNGSPAFNVALLSDRRLADVDVAVKLRARDGRIDQGGGVVWRAQDARNYYIARYNPLEDNYRVYTVKDGRRRQLESADIKSEHGAWHPLRVVMKGDHIECFLDGEKHLEIRDDTFADAGLVGLWTKADAQTEFDDFELRALEGQLAQ